YQMPKSNIHMVDINERALQLARENAKQNSIDNVHIKKSDGLQALEGEKFAAIITNPPIRQGKQLIYQLFAQAQKSLLPNGELWIVMQKKQGAPSALKYLRTLFSKAEIITRNKGYYIIVAK